MKSKKRNGDGLRIDVPMLGEGLKIDVPMLGNVMV